MTGWTDRWVTSDDGLRLHARDYGPAEGPLAPVICLPGLSLNARSFADVAPRIAGRAGRERRVLALDLRGRGQSEHDRNVANYNPQREALDVLAVMGALGVARAAIIGTSRGGIVAMAVAAMRPPAVAGVVLNDIGPRIEQQGLMRIAEQLSHQPSLDSWEAAVAMLKALFAEGFTDLTEADWQAFARGVFAEREGRPVRDFDPRIVDSLQAANATATGVPEFWFLFDALASVPVLAIRGANSDILAAATLEAMAARHQDFEAVTVPARGHAPFLTEPAAEAAIDRFLDRVDRRAAAPA